MKRMIDHQTVKDMCWRMCLCREGGTDAAHSRMCALLRNVQMDGTEKPI